MHAGLKVAVATLVMLASLVGGALVLTDSVYASLGPRNHNECGPVGMVARGTDHVLSGGEVPGRTDEWYATCVSEARQEALWAVPPLVAGLASVLYLGVGFSRVVRRSTAEGRSQGALVG